MKNVCPAIEDWEGPVDDIDNAYQDIRCNLIFDIKIGENFRQKENFVAGGHTTNTPAFLTYTSVVT